MFIVFIMFIIFGKTIYYWAIELFEFISFISAEKCAADSTTNSNIDATVSYESDSDHELYFFEDEDSDENSDHHQ